MKDQSTFSKNLKKARLLKNWKQEAAAKLIGIKPSSYAMIERGEREPNLRIFARICDTFRIVDPLKFLQDENYSTAQNVQTTISKDQAA
jgi:transcriptional regulator with XRE-family HTH domain